VASVIAIVSRAVFEKTAGTKACLGEALSLDRYAANPKAFASLEEGGALFLVTVRPPEEELWLVAIIEHPQRKGDVWVGQKNRSPIVRINELLPKLRFATGKGIAPKPGALGMSLQTPRVLTETDEKLLREISLFHNKSAPIAKDARLPPAPSKSQDSPWWPVAALATFEATKPGRRRELGQRVENALGSSWKLLPLDDALALPFLHVPTNLRFRLVPGGSMQMGLSEADIEDCAKYAGEYPDEVATLEKRATPLRTVVVAPFLCTNHPMTHKELRRLAPEHMKSGENLKRDAARAVAAKLGFRLTSEAELEWLARNGSDGSFVCDLVGTKSLRIDDDEVVFEEEKVRSAFGITDLLAALWAEDDWHPNFNGAPITSEPWMNGKPEGVTRWTDLSNILCGGNELVWSYLSAMREKPIEPARVMLAAPLSRWIPELANSNVPPPSSNVPPPGGRTSKPVPVSSAEKVIDWKKLRTSDGPATAIPKLLQGLAKGGTKQDSTANLHMELVSGLVGEGKWFTATAPSVAELLRLLPKAAEPNALLSLLAEMVGADHLRGWLSPITESCAPKVRSVLDENRQLILSQLLSKEPRVRSAGAMLVSVIGEWREETLPMVVSMALKDPAPLARASALLAIGRLGQNEKALDLLDSTVKTQNTSDEVRGAATLALLRAEPTSTLHTPISV
jgi:hypothetical protein